MPEDIQVFHVDLGPLDALLLAADFYGALARSDWRMERDRRRAIPILVSKGESLACVMLEAHFGRLFSPSAPADAAEPVAFLMRRPPRESRAFVVERPFEMRSYPLRDFRLPPRGLRSYLRALGLSAVRFDGPGRIQYLLDPGALEPVPDRGRSA